MKNGFFDFAADDQKRREIARAQGESVGVQLARTPEYRYTLPSFQTISDQDAFFAGAYAAYQREVHDPCLTFADFLNVVCSRGELHTEAV